MVEFSKKSSPVSLSFIDSNARCRYLRLWWMSTEMLSGSSPLVLSVLLLCRWEWNVSEKHATCLFTKTHQNNKLSRQQWQELNTAERLYFLLFYGARHPKRGFFSSVFNALQYCAMFLGVCQPELLWAWPSTRPQDPSLVYFTAQTRYQSGRECGPAQHQRCHGYMKRFSQTGTDPLPTICWLLNKSAPQRFQVFYYSGKTQFHFEWIQGNKTESQRRHRYARLRKRNLSRSQNFIK